MRGSTRYSRATWMLACRHNMRFLMSKIDDLAKLILDEVVGGFMGKKLDSDALNEEYVGVSIARLESKHCADGTRPISAIAFLASVTCTTLHCNSGARLLGN